MATLNNIIEANKSLITTALIIFLVIIVLLIVLDVFNKIIKFILGILGIIALAIYIMGASGKYNDMDFYDEPAQVITVQGTVQESP
jgi:hypothetical protein